MRSNCPVLAAVVFALTVGAAACSKQPAAVAPAPVLAPSPGFKIVATAKQVMLAITIPSSDAIFAAAGTSPQTDEEWAKVENAALALAESGNLLLMEGRAVDHDHWEEYAHGLIDAASQAIAAARAKDVDQISAAGDAILPVCENCHKQYMPQTAAPQSESPPQS